MLRAGAEPIVKGLHTYQYGVASESNQSCTQQMAQRAALQAAATKRNRTAPPIDFGMCVRGTPRHLWLACPLSTCSAHLAACWQVGGSVRVS